MKTKKLIKQVIFLNTIIANIYYKKRYGNDISDDLLISRIRQIAHRFDHRLMKAMSAKKEDLYEIEYLLNIAAHRGLKFEDSLMWALSLYAMAKLNAVNSYTLKLKEKKDNNNSILSKLIKERRSVRKWEDDKVDLELIKDIIRTSLWSPSSCNRQPIRIIILEDEQKEFIKKYFYGSFWYNAPVQLLVFCNISAYSNTDIFFPYLDGGAFIQNMLLLLHEAGLGACWLGFKKWNTKKEFFCDKKEFDNFHEYFDLGEEFIPISMIVAGKYKLIPKAPARQSSDTVIIRGKE